MSDPFLRDDDSAVRLPLCDVFGQRLWRRAGQYAAVEIESAIVTGAPENRLRRLIRDRATLVGALGAESVQLILRLQNDHPLAAHRDDDEFILLKFRCFISRQTRRSGRSGLRQRLQITNNWICNARDPTKQTRTQENIDKMAARRC